MIELKNYRDFTSFLILSSFCILFSTFAYAQVSVCPDPETGSNMLQPGSGEDLEVTGQCTAQAGTYNYGYVNIYNGGELIFEDAVIDFWASSILIENNGSLIAGDPVPIGTNDGVLTIHLYGANQGASGGDDPISCLSGPTCGVHTDDWNSNGSMKVSLPGNQENDFFYAYENLPYWVDGNNSPANQGFFGHKVLAVSYGGILKLHGVKGSSAGDIDSSDSGTSWVRLDGSINPGGKTLKLDRKVKLDRAGDWQESTNCTIKDGDQIVVTTTDYLPGHSEQLTIDTISSDGMTITVCEPFKYMHYGKKYDIKTQDRVTDGIDRLGLKFDKAETRAAVALLSRSIRIVSGGNDLNETFPPEETHYFYGGHLIARQGFKLVQLQGVEFYQMGQGGRMARYPVHLHLARKTPKDTYLKDNSIHDSMTRWITLHGTHGVLLERNVGYKSIGHGFYLEDGTEIENEFYSNIGIFARAAVDNVQNPRKVPGILSAPGKETLSSLGKDNPPFHSDFMHPTVFWIMNGWNDFEYNMAAGAGTCGSCYWFVPGKISGLSRDQEWASYASIQKNFAGITPIKNFKGNFCTTAALSLNFVGTTFQCTGVGAPPIDANDKFLKGIKNDAVPAINDTNIPPAPPPPVSPEAIAYFPDVDQGASRIATLCDAKAKGVVVKADGDLDCSGVERCSGDNSKTNCAVAVIDEYTTSFHWAEHNSSAVWLRPLWSLVSNSFISDVQNAGLTFVTGGDYTKSSSPTGNWLLAYKNVFVGNTQKNNPHASHAGPVNPDSDLTCDNPAFRNNYCLLEDEGINFVLSDFANNQRLFNIYDGPAQQDSNAYLDITRTEVGDCKLNGEANNGNCQNSKYMYGRIQGMPFNKELNKCVLPNAAIAWKQSNGFYYPPSFHSANLFFDKVDIRHFVINPLFETGTRKTDTTSVSENYCTHTFQGTFVNFTEVDRQTVLNDDDGSLTGYQRTISVNEDVFFNAPIETVECASDGTAKTSPYEYVTTAIYPGCAANLKDIPNPDAEALSRCGGTFWAKEATNQATYGVPMYRQLLTRTENSGDLQMQSPSIRLMGMAMWQRSTLTPNNATYYIDTTVSQASQQKSGTPLTNVFKAGETYYVYLIFATENTKQTYELYVGENFDIDSVNAVQTPLLTINPNFNEAAEFPGTWEKVYIDENHEDFDTHPHILRVTMNMDFKKFKDGIAAEKINSCAPASFCEWKGNTCGCSDKLKDYDNKNGTDLFKLCSQKNAQGEDAVCRWSGIDVDCPAGGCWGFSFTLPLSFVPEDCDESIGSPNQCGRTVSAGGKRPDPGCFPSPGPPPEPGSEFWNIPWIEAIEVNGKSVAGPSPVCAGSPVEPKNFCSSPQTEADVARNLITGTEDDDYISGTPDSDVIRGLGGDDLIFGLEGNDFIQGGPGDDLIFGGRGDDNLQGNGGDDNIDGYTGDDNLNGGEGFDNLDGGLGSDECSEGEDEMNCES